jgi:hypothetical protein
VGIVTERREGPWVFHHLQTPCILRAFGCAAEVVQADKKRRDDYLKTAIV